MSDLDELGLTDADLDRALATTLDRGNRLVRRRNRRTGLVGGLGIVVLLLGGFGVLRTLSDDDRGVVVEPAGGGNQELAPTASTTTTPSVSTTTPSPLGFSRVESGGVLLFTNTTPEPNTARDVGGGVSIGGGIVQVRSADLVAASVIDPERVALTFRCERSGDDRLEALRVRVDGSRLVVQGTIIGISGGTECTAGSGTRIEVTLPGAGLSADTEISTDVLEP